MGDIRKDYVLDRFVIVPQTIEETGTQIQVDKCPYCPGNEGMTEPASITLVAKDGMLQRLSDNEENIVTGWCVRVFESSNPVVKTSSTSYYSDKPLYSEPAYGYHQVVVASPEHAQALSEISVEQWENVLLVIQDRVRWLYTQKSVTYVSIYVNSGEAGVPL